MVLVYKLFLEQSRVSLLTRASELTGVAAERIFAVLMVLFTGRQHRDLVTALSEGMHAAITSRRSVLIQPDVVADEEESYIHTMMQVIKRYKGNDISYHPMAGNKEVKMYM